MEEIDASWEGMVELGIANPPLPLFDLELSASAVFAPVEGSDPSIAASIAKWTLRFRYDQGHQADAMISPRWRSIIYQDLGDGFVTEVINLGDALYKILLVSLATRNVEKATTEHKLYRMGIGKPRHRFTTVVRIGAMAPSHTAPDAHGTSKRPHLRRGHIRRQHHGPQGQLVKKIWIEPLFVNADKGEIAGRAAYKLVAHP